MKPDAAVTGDLIVTKQVRRSVVSGHKNVLIAVSIEITNRQAAAYFGRTEPPASFGADFMKISLTVIQEQLRRLGVSHISNRPYSVVNVAVYGNQIEPAVEIAISKSTSEPEGGL